jgi:hypothetical protein
MMDGISLKHAFAQRSFKRRFQEVQSTAPSRLQTLANGSYWQLICGHAIVPG